MSRRTGLRFPLVKDPELKDVPWFGHPCGGIAPISWLAKRPALSIQVSHYMVGDAGGSLWNWSSFASMLYDLQQAGGALHRDARRLVKRWTRAGKPAPWRIAEVLKLDIERNILEWRVDKFLTAADCITIGAVER